MVAEADCSIEMHPYADKSQPARDLAKYKDTSPSLFNFRNNFSSIWSQYRQKEPAIAELSHTRYRYYIETIVSFYSTYVPIVASAALLHAYSTVE